MNRKMVLFFVSCVFWICLAPQDALPQDYPTREIEFIVGYAPGSSSDSVARVVAKYGEKYAGKPIIVVNKPGGGGSRGFTPLAAGDFHQNFPRPGCRDRPLHNPQIPVTKEDCRFHRFRKIHRGSPFA